MKQQETRNQIHASWPGEFMHWCIISSCCAGRKICVGRSSDSSAIRIWLVVLVAVPTKLLFECKCFYVGGEVYWHGHVVAWRGQEYTVNNGHWKGHSTRVLENGHKRCSREVSQGRWKGLCTWALEYGGREKKGKVLEWDSEVRSTCVARVITVL